MHGTLTLNVLETARKRIIRFKSIAVCYRKRLGHSGGYIVIAIHWYYSICENSSLSDCKVLN